MILLLEQMNTRSSKKNIVANGSTHTKVLDENERAMVEQSILRFYPTLTELSKIQIYQVASVTVHETCNKKRFEHSLASRI